MKRMSWTPCLCFDRCSERSICHQLGWNAWLERITMCGDMCDSHYRRRFLHPHFSTSRLSSKNNERHSSSWILSKLCDGSDKRCQQSLGKCLRLLLSYRSISDVWTEDLSSIRIDLDCAYWGQEYVPLAIEMEDVMFDQLPLRGWTKLRFSSLVITISIIVSDEVNGSPRIFRWTIIN